MCGHTESPQQPETERARLCLLLGLDLLEPRRSLGTGQHQEGLVHVRTDPWMGSLP